MFKKLLLAAVTALLLSGCNKEDLVLFTNEYGFGTVVSGEVLRTDGGLTYHIVKNESGVDLEAGKRAIYVCDIVKQKGDNDYTVNLKQLSYPLAKNIIRVATATDEDKVQDPINIDMLWKAGGFINMRLNLMIPTEGTQNPHLLNLILDPQTNELSLHHNSYGEYWGASGMEKDKLSLASTYVCFKYDGILDLGEYTVTWSWHKTDEDGNLLEETEKKDFKIEL